MWRTIAIIFISFGLVFSVADAQESAWSVWVYDAANTRAIQVDQDGAILNDEILPVPAHYAPGSYTLSYGLAVAHDGTHLAYSITGTDNSSGIEQTTLIVYDVASDGIIATYQPPLPTTADALSLMPRPRLFNLTGGALAYSYAAGDTPEDQRWRLVVLDLMTGGIIAELDNNNPAITRQNFEGQIAPVLLPAIMYYEGATVSFSLVAFGGMAYGQEFINFAWDAITGRVAETNQFPNLAGDYLPRIGDSIVPISDARVPADDDYMPYANTLHVYRTDMGARVPFFASSTLDLIQADFVQNGEQVVARAESLADFSEVWMLIDRIGTARALPLTNVYQGAIIGVPDGFVYLSESEPQVAILANTATNPIEQAAFWIAPEGTQFIPVWSTAPSPNTEYPAWAQLAPPLFIAQTVIVPDDGGVTASEVSANAQAAGSGILTVNGVAIIRTTEGDRLNMRSNPSLGGDIVARAEDGSRVVLLDGPIANDGFAWWQVRLNTGLVGWVVESADGVKTLIPAG